MTTWVWRWTLACGCESGARVLERNRHSLGEVLVCGQHGSQATVKVWGHGA